MNELDIQLNVNPTCELVATDRTSYQNLHYEYGGEIQYLRDRNNHVSIEFLTDVYGEVMYDTINLEKELTTRMELVDGNTSVFYFPKDGIFTYYKFLVPHISHLFKKDSESLDDIFVVYDQTFFYDDNFYFCESRDNVVLSEFSSWEAAVEYIVSISKKLDVGEL